MKPKKPIISRDLADLMRPGFMVEIDPADVDRLGLVEETALDEADAWESNADVENTNEATDGR
ncbi:hypothetical protein [Acidocella aminolytica]|uniref:Uncharacterized protein n=1 Tax=Acidocella aminolytica 101 = DSM 11237 TaxID=1120923 RepID=A0A0D6PHK3_9PROT|nr:hypothetical protein [Acidocella aminolytica]GAN81132.1 hypothetical protein Aam_078_009 [Acidocella aminolytica 101 = DSM 11237]GBQ33821.1 hypothetical protein AA11237_0580 [Acidocella aminolytica 101 = DSM 11237]SHF24519.1 hypothetical protein SAMN02746095_02575 [Acidocella aminolytica 101 = DSM 11237]